MTARRSLISAVYVRTEVVDGAKEHVFNVRVAPELEALVTDAELALLIERAQLDALTLRRRVLRRLRLSRALREVRAARHGAGLVPVPRPEPIVPAERSGDPWATFGDALR